MAIGRVGVRPYGGGTSTTTTTTAVSFDTDAQAFITATAITDTTQKNAINDLVLDLKAAGVWTKMKALYPMVGGTATTHKFNLKDPRDLDAAYRLVFAGGGTHDANGYQLNGTTAYADTFLAANTMAQNSTHFSFYSRTNRAGSGNVIMGYQTGTQVSLIYPRYTDNNTYIAVNRDVGVSSLITAVTNTTGLYVANRTSSTNTILYKNNIISSTNSSTSIAPPSISYYLGTARNLSLYDNLQCAFSSIGDGLTDLESTLFYQIVEKYQYALGRNVNANQTFYFNRNYSNETNAFIFNGAISDATQQSAINTLVNDLKAAGIWTKMKALYPMVGGTATAHKFNLVNPVDTDAAYRLVFNGGWTHSSTGALPNGSTGYATMGSLNMNTLNTADVSVGFYSRTNVGLGVYYDMGATNNVDTGWFMLNPRTGVNQINYQEGSSIFLVSNTDSKGFYQSSTTATNVHKVFKNGTVVGSNTITQAKTPFNSLMYLGAGYITTGGFYYSAREQAFSYVSNGLTDLESNLFYQIVEKYQYALGRNVNANQTFYFNRNYSNETNAFIFNGAISDATQQSAINTLVNDLKAAGIWTKMKAVYPMVGGTATAHKFNLVNPIDSTSAYALTFAGGWTHTSNGATPNGTTGYADTNLTPYDVLIGNNVHLSVYSRTNNSTQGKYEIGMQDDAVTGQAKEYWQSWYGYVAGKSLGGIQSGFHAQYNETDSLGMLTTTRTSSTILKIYKNGTYKAIDTNSTGGRLLPMTTMPIGAFKYRNSSNVITYSYGIREIAFSSIGDGLTDAEATTFYNAVQAFQTTLGRQV